MWFALVRGCWPQLLFLIVRCMPTLRELIVVTALPLSSQPATGLSALAPAQRAGAQRLCAMARLGPPGMSAFALLLGDKRTSSAPANFLIYE